MKRILLVLGMVLALAMTAMADAEPDYPDPGITSPTAGEVIYENTLYLAGSDVEAQDNAANWAVRYGTCEVNDPATRAGNVAGFDDPYFWEDGAFSANVEIGTWDPGMYCFVLNTTVGEADGSRLLQPFYIVDDYAKVGGVIDLSDGKPSKGNGTHAMEGVVGIAGTHGTVGSVTINYRELGEVCTFTPGAFSRNNAPGIGVEEGLLRGDLTNFDNSCGGTARLLVLDRDASDDYPRGAIYVDGADFGYGIDLDPNTNTGPGNWVPMLKGNNHVGTR